MTPTEYKEAGYRVSLQVSQADIDRAEADVTAAYVAAVAPEADPSTDDDAKAAVMQLAVIALLQRAAVATRAGGKTKTSPSLSEQGQPTQHDLDNADRLLRSIQTESGLPSELVDDICGIYYRKKFLSL